MRSTRSLGKRTRRSARVIGQNPNRRRRKVKTSRFTLTELVVAFFGLAMVGLVIFGLYAIVHFALKFW